MGQQIIKSGALAIGLLGVSLVLSGCESLGLEQPDWGWGSDQATNDNAPAPDTTVSSAPVPPPTAADTQAAVPVTPVVTTPAPEAKTPWYAMNTTPASEPVASQYGASSYSSSSYSAPMAPAANGKTIVGQKADAIRTQLDQLEADTNAAVSTLNDMHQKSQSISSSYFSTVGEINSRLQVGTTPGNPHLVQHWQEASADLDQFATIGGQMSQLSNRLANDASQVSYLLDETRAAFGLSGAVDEDHDQLRALEDELQKSEIQVTRTREEVAKQIERHNDYVATERRNLETLSLAIARGEYYGQNLTNISAFGGERDFAPIGTGRVSTLRAPTHGGVLGVNTSPFVVIRFNHTNVDYGQPLYQAMSEALKKNPDGNFDVLAVTPADYSGKGPSAYQKAQDVASSMAQMGVPRDRISITTTSKNVVSPEVQVFLR